MRLFMVADIYACTESVFLFVVWYKGNLYLWESSISVLHWYITGTLYFKHLAHFTASTEQNYIFKWGTWKCLLPILKTEFLVCALCVLACCHVFHLRTSNRCNRTNVVDPQLYPPWGSWLGSAPRIALVEVPPHNWPEKYTLVSMFWFYSSPVDVKDLRSASNWLCSWL